MKNTYSLILLITALFCSTFAYSSEAPVQSEEAEMALLEVIDHMRNGNNEDALKAAEKLNKNYPNFKLGKIIYADLLSSYLRKKPKLGSISEDKGLIDLKDEAKARINFSSIYKTKDLLPKSIIMLADNIPYAFLVELSKSCLLYTSPSPRDGLLSRMPSSA